MMALAIAIEYKKAPKTDTHMIQLGEKKNPNPWRQLKAKNSRKNTVALTETKTNELQTWVTRRGLKSDIIEEKDGSKLGFC